MSCQVSRGIGSRIHLHLSVSSELFQYLRCSGTHRVYKTYSDTEPFVCSMLIHLQSGCELREFSNETMMHHFLKPWVIKVKIFPACQGKPAAGMRGTMHAMWGWDTMAKQQLHVQTPLAPNNPSSTNPPHPVPQEEQMQLGTTHHEPRGTTASLPGSVQ